MVESRERILSKTKLALRPMTILTSPTRRQGSSRNAPRSEVPLTPFRLTALEVCLKQYEKVLDYADDVIHRALTVYGGFVAPSLQQ